MSDNNRRFEAADPFGRVWQVEFRWQQNAISIRHADAVDLKYYIAEGAGGGEKREVVVALPHALLCEAAKSCGREVSDAWCLRLGGMHVRHMIGEWTDMETPVATVPAEELDRYSRAIEEADAAERERLAHTR